MQIGEVCHDHVFDRHHHFERANKFVYLGVNNSECIDQASKNAAFNVTFRSYFPFGLQSIPCFVGEPAKNEPKIDAVIRFVEKIKNARKKAALEIRNNNKMHIRTGFVAYSNSNCVRYREKLFDLFVHFAKEKNYTRLPEAFGSCNGKHPELSKKFEKKKIDHFNVTQYQFSSSRYAIAMENQPYDGYLTEKIFNGLLSGAIPIYYGDRNTAEKLFKLEGGGIIWHDINNPEKTLYEVEKLENDIDYYLEYLERDFQTKEQEKYLYDLVYGLREIVYNIIENK